MSRKIKNVNDINVLINYNLNLLDSDLHCSDVCGPTSLNMLESLSM